MSNYNTLLVTCSAKSYTQKLKDFCDEFSSKVTVKHIDNDINNYDNHDVVVIGPNFVKTENRLSNIQSVFNYNYNKNLKSLVVLGDSNMPVLKSLNMDTSEINNHNLQTTELHNMKHHNGATMWIPSNHHTSFIPDKYCSFGNSSSYVNIITLAYKRDKLFGLLDGEDEKNYDESFLHHQEPEIFCISNLKYLGIYGAPEYFFSDGYLKNSHMANHTMSLIQKLIDDL